MLDSGSIPRDMDHDRILKPRNKTEEAAVLDEGLVKCEVAKGVSNIPRMIDISVKLTS